MKINRATLNSKLELMTLAGFADEHQSGWDTAIPQAWFDQLKDMGIEYPTAWFATHHQGGAARIVHVGEAYSAFLSGRSSSNQESFHDLFQNHVSDNVTEYDDAMYHAFIDNDDVMDELDAGLLSISLAMRMFHAGYLEGLDAASKAINTIVNDNEKAPQVPR